MDRLVAANSWPFLMYSTDDLGPQGNRRISPKVENAGVGPARIQTFEVWWSAADSMWRGCSCKCAPATGVRRVLDDGSRDDPCATGQKLSHGKSLVHRTRALVRSKSSVEDRRALKRGTKPMDMEKLKRLRARYADRGAFDGDDPVLLRAARDVQVGDGRRFLPFAGVPTFLGLPHATSL